MAKTIYTHIDIDAPAGVVWQVLTELRGYQDWNPFVRYAEGTIALGEELLLKPTLPGSRRPLSFRATVTTCVPEAEFAWTGIQLHAAIAAGEHIFRLVPMTEHKTRLHHNEVFTGILAPLVMAIGGKRTQRGFVLMNEATKKRAEERFASASHT